MQFCVLGRTGLRVSVIGLGCGGPSRLGLAGGAQERAAISLIDAALELGINVVDTAAAYGNERTVGNALRQRREHVVLSSKILVPRHLSRIDPASPMNRGYRAANARLGRYLSGLELRRSLEQTLRRLQTEYLDILYLHAITPAQYPHCVTELLPVLQQLRHEGKVRYLGISETLADTGHRMLSEAISDNCWDVIMLHFCQTHLSARVALLPGAAANGLGVVVMAAARHIGASANLHQSEGVSGGTPKRRTRHNDHSDDTGFISSHAEAYQFCLQEPGVDVVLTGTGNLTHLQDTVRRYR